MVSVYPGRGGSSPRKPAPPLPDIGVEDRPVVDVFTSARPVALAAMGCIDFHAPVGGATIIVIAVLGRVGRGIYVGPLNVNDGHDWLEPTSPRNSHAFRVRL